MGAIAILDNQALENRVRLLNNLEVPGLTHLIAKDSDEIGIRSGGPQTWIPGKLLLPNGKEPKILKATSPINAYIEYQHEDTGAQISEKISELVKKISESMYRFDNWYFAPNAFSISELRRTAEYYAGGFREDEPLWQFNLAFYKIKK